MESTCYILNLYTFHNIYATELFFCTSFLWHIFAPHIQVYLKKKENTSTYHLTGNSMFLGRRRQLVYLKVFSIFHEPFSSVCQKECILCWVLTGWYRVLPNEIVFPSGRCFPEQPITCILLLKFIFGRQHFYGCIKGYWHKMLENNDILLFESINSFKTAIWQ